MVENIQCLQRIQLKNSIEVGGNKEEEKSWQGGDSKIYTSRAFN